MQGDLYDDTCLNTRIQLTVREAKSEARSNEWFVAFLLKELFTIDSLFLFLLSQHPLFLLPA